MRVKSLAVLLSSLILGTLLTGCATLPWDLRTETDIDCSNANTTAMLQSGEYKRKVDNFIVIQDASATMGERYGAWYADKIDVSKSLVKCMNNTLPSDYDSMAGMREFGPINSEKGLIYGMEQYSNAGLDGAVSSITGTGGVTPLANAIIYGGYDLLDTPGLTDMPGKTAMIIFSDGLNTQKEDPVAAAAAIKDMYGNNICIYTVHIGDDPAGAKTLMQIADAGKCGFATADDILMSSDGMEDFVTQVFLEKLPPRPEPKPEPVYVPQKQRVSIALYVQFDLDKAVVKPEFHKDIEKVADFLKEFPDATGVLEGHTCSLGTDAYNQKLSERRAESVKAYLVTKFGIEGSRLTTVGYGETRPVASNDTEESRMKNRRVVADIVTFTLK